ncbi:MAG: radical SAM protein [bacterium]|nr:radical SAM protein [bacterium]
MSGPAPSSTASDALPRRGLGGLDDLLSAPKARLARRFVATGRAPDPAEFHRAGLTLSPTEQTAITRWLESGLATTVREQHRAQDGTIKLRLGLVDDREIETVAMPVGAVCVSSQVGCAVGCRFCASGMFGVERHLTADEILEQVVHARRLMPIDRVVFMGMGEPSHNLENVLTAVTRIRNEALISPRRQTLSTVGAVKVFERMKRSEFKPCLAVSLHLANDARRRELLPRAHGDTVQDIVAAADEYGRSMRTPVQFEWTLLRGVNDGDRDVDQLCELLQGVRGYVNFIVYNHVDGLPFEPPSRERIVTIVRQVKERGILATIRDSSGADANAACGQLRVRAIS